MLFLERCLVPKPENIILALIQRTFELRLYQLKMLAIKRILVSRSLTHQSTLTLVHAFVTSRVDSCSSLLVGFPLGTLTRLDRVLRSAASLVGRLPKFSPITAYMRHVLHWLPISQRIQHRITALVSRCDLRCAPSYLRDLCCPVSDLAARRVLRSVRGVSSLSLGHV